MSLYELTRTLHHEAETHPWGKRMAVGDITMKEYADWLGALSTIHEALDPNLPVALQRCGALMEDTLACLPEQGTPNKAASEFAKSLHDPVSIGGAAYIMIGAHFRGGAVIRKRMEPKGFPCRHLRFSDAAAADQFLKLLRPLEDLAPGAQRCFRATINVMEEIQGG